MTKGDKSNSTTLTGLEGLHACRDYEDQGPTSYPESEPGLRSARLGVSVERVNWLTVYPNPSQEYFSIRLSKAPLTPEASYVLTDIMGKTVAGGRLALNTMEYIVDVSSLTNGVYTLSIIDMDQLIYVEKIIRE